MPDIKCKLLNNEIGLAFYWRIIWNLLTLDWQQQSSLLLLFIWFGTLWLETADAHPAKIVARRAVVTPFLLGSKTFPHPRLF